MAEKLCKYKSLLNATLVTKQFKVGCLNDGENLRWCQAADARSSVELNNCFAQLNNFDFKNQQKFWYCFIGKMKIQLFFTGFLRKFSWIIYCWWTKCVSFTGKIFKFVFITWIKTYSSDKQRHGTVKIEHTAWSSSEFVMRWLEERISIKFNFSSSFLFAFSSTLHDMILHSWMFKGGAIIITHTNVSSETKEEELKIIFLCIYIDMIHKHNGEHFRSIWVCV